MSNFAVAGTMAIVVVGLTAIGGCVPSYATRGARGGFSETVISADVARVKRKRGDLYTSGSQAKDFTLLRAAEIMVDNGLPYFAVLREGNASPNTPGYYEINGIHATYVSDERFIKYTPETGLLVRGFREKPEEIFTLDAKRTIENIKSKYGID